MGTQPGSPTGSSSSAGSSPTGGSGSGQCAGVGAWSSGVSSPLTGENVSLTAMCSSLCTLVARPLSTGRTSGPPSGGRRATPLEDLVGTGSVLTEMI